MSTSTVFLSIEAPFAAFRWLQAGVYRGTYPIIPPSAAWGLALNLAGIETRGSLDEVTTSIRADAPHLEIAVGLFVLKPQRSTVYQQLHGYPVGASGKELQANAHGQKYWIAPARREVLVDLRCLVGVRGDASIVARIPEGLAGTLPVQRYGLPFAGDNQFMFNRIDVVGETQAKWFVPITETAEVQQDSVRLTTNIDRGDGSRTAAPMFAPTSERCRCPVEAWVDIGPVQRSR